MWFNERKIMKLNLKNYAQKKIFGNPNNLKTGKNINLLTLPSGDLNKCSIEFLYSFLKSDVYIVFGSSYIKDDLANFLIKHKALNIHLGISPYYRGTDCNFWALFDNNPHLVGATIHLLSKGLDSGPILYHALSEIKEDPFIYTMSAVKSAFESIAQKIENKTIFEHTPEIQDKSKEIKYSKKNEFNDEVIKKFFLNKIDLNEAEKLLKEAEKKEQESNQLIEFTKEIKKSSTEFKHKIIEILWKIVYSDGASDDFESNLIRRVCGLLYVSDRDSGIIKSKVINSMK